MAKGYDPDWVEEKLREELVEFSTSDPSVGENQDGLHVGCGPERSGLDEEGTCRRQVGPVGGMKNLTTGTPFIDKGLGAQKNRREARES